MSIQGVGRVGVPREDAVQRPSPGIAHPSTRSSGLPPTVGRVPDGAPATVPIASVSTSMLVAVSVPSTESA